MKHISLLSAVKVVICYYSVISAKKYNKITENLALKK
jgi:hypothetical protein